VREIGELLSILTITARRGTLDIVISAIELIITSLGRQQGESTAPRVSPLALELARISEDYRSVLEALSVLHWHTIFPGRTRNCGK